MKDNKPFISILLPIANAQAFLADALTSLLCQSYKDFEIIAIDDFSKDSSYKILKDFRKKDKRLKISRNVKKYGMAITLNRAIKKAKGTQITFMDAEDVMYKDRLKKQVQFLLANPKVVAVGTQCTYLSERNKRVGVSAFPYENDTIYNKPLHGIAMQFETVMINKYLLPKDILFFQTSGEAFLYTDLFMRLLQYGQLTNLAIPLQYHRKHDEAKDSLMKKIPSFTKLLLRSFSQYDYRPSLRALLPTPFREIELTTNS
ncbi:MAG: glycosyltransferase family 2 protein [Candidatus Levyibacteriota bacterium]